MLIRNYLVLFEVIYGKTTTHVGAGPQAVNIVAHDIKEAEATANEAIEVMNEASGFKKNTGASWRVKSITRIGVTL